MSINEYSKLLKMFKMPEFFHETKYKGSLYSQKPKIYNEKECSKYPAAAIKKLSQCDVKNIRVLLVLRYPMKR